MGGPEFKKRFRRQQLAKLLNIPVHELEIQAIADQENRKFKHKMKNIFDRVLEILSGSLSLRP